MDVTDIAWYLDDTMLASARWVGGVCLFDFNHMVHDRPPWRAHLMLVRLWVLSLHLLQHR